MKITKKFDRAFQWAGEKMGQESKTGMSEEFKMLETEMALRHDGMERLQKSMNIYIKSLSRRGETFDDKEKGLPVSYLGRTMISHGEDFEPDSEFGNSLIAMGRANERIAGIQESYVAHASNYWLESLERSLATMKEYQVGSARKKLENRRLAYDASMAKMQKAKREDFRLEDELRTSKAKYEESSEDVLRRMQDIQEAEADSVSDLTQFLDAELDYYDRCAEELRRVRRDWVSGQSQPASYSRGGQSDYGLGRRPTNRSRSNTTRSYGGEDRTERWASAAKQDIYEDEEMTPEPVRMPIRSNRLNSNSGIATPTSPPRPAINRASTYSTPAPTMPPNVNALRNGLRPVSKLYSNQNTSQDVFADDYDTNTSSGSPEYDRCESPATSYGSLSRTTSNTGLSGSMKKGPPPPPPSRAKKPPPPIPQRLAREVGY
ncbi:uncharacterized protein BCR38DRAFT_330921 [Pseudomassariella vexata]|uniref:BAR domain-containing protein n=1 Tax=Pseudomassariella vexata TaxID=1141098 RepID=A0A1Y2EIH7_9PEZI|nr:uncharacterized protein BCR38DRAFT_330921 [Pseudomassariella vexata]ORY71381.1 hypothetical protein BCR38DRAFT_330921 [Pseudomassariella vexata]